MIWHFLDTKTLEEYDSGYILTLTNGSWLLPIEIASTAPVNMNSLQQANYLQEGLQFAREKLENIMADAI